jgi:hypothetical protein
MAGVADVNAMARSLRLAHRTQLCDHRGKMHFKHELMDVNAAARGRTIEANNTAVRLPIDLSGRRREALVANISADIKQLNGRCGESDHNTD